MEKRIDETYSGREWLGFEIARVAVARLRAFEDMHEENMAWLDDYLTECRDRSDKTLLPKTPKRARRKRKATDTAEESPTRPPKRCSTRISERMSSKKSNTDRVLTTRQACLQQQQQVTKPPVTFGSPVIQTLSATSSHTLKSVAMVKATAAKQIEGFNQLSVKDKAHAYEALVNGKDIIAAPSPSSKCATPDRSATKRAEKVVPAASQPLTSPQIAVPGKESSTTVAPNCASKQHTDPEDVSHAKIQQDAAGLGVVPVAPALARTVVPKEINHTRANISAKPVQDDDVASVAQPARKMLHQPKACPNASSSRSSVVADASEVINIRSFGDSGYQDSVKGVSSANQSSLALQSTAAVECRTVIADNNANGIDVTEQEPSATSVVCPDLSNHDQPAASACSSLASVQVVVPEPQENSPSAYGTRVTRTKMRRVAKASYMEDSFDADDECVRVPAVHITVNHAPEQGSCEESDSDAEGVHVPMTRTKTRRVQEMPLTSAHESSACLRVTRSKMRHVPNTVSVVTPSTVAAVESYADRGCLKRPNETSPDIQDGASAKRLRAKDATIFTMQTATSSSSCSAPVTAHTMKKALTDSCLTSKKYATPDCVRATPLTLGSSTQRTFLTSKSSSSILNRSITSPSVGHTASVIMSFVKRPTPGHGVTEKEKQILKEKKLLAKEHASAEKRKRINDILQEKLESHKRHREEKSRRAAEVRDLQDREKVERHRVLEQKQVDKIEALSRVKESKIREEKEKAKLRDQKLLEAEERRKEQEAKATKQEEEEAKIRHAREQEERERLAAKARAENEQRALELRRREQEEKERLAAKLQAETEQRLAQEARQREAERAERIKRQAEEKERLLRQRQADKEREAQLASATAALTKPISSSLNEKEQQLEEKKARVQAEERRLLAAAVSVKVAISAEQPLGKLTQSTATVALKDQTNTGGSAAPIKSSCNPRVTITKVTPADSYEMTPPRSAIIRHHKSSDPDNYDISDLNSGDDTDDDVRPRKVVPVWAQGSQFKCSLVNQYYHPRDTCEIFPEYLRLPCDLSAVFKKNKPRFAKRTSSAIWDSPLLKL